MLKGEVVQSSVKSSLMKEETKLEAVFASSPNGITVTDQNVNITECNQATLDMFGYSSKDEVIGKNALEFFAKKDQQRAMENLKKTLEQGSMANVEYTFLAKDGHEFPAELSASTIKDISGRPTGFVAIVRDITERKKAEAALVESERWYRSLFANMNSGFAFCKIVSDNDGKPIDYVILEVNDDFEKLTRLRKEVVIGKRVSEVFFSIEKDPTDWIGICGRVAATGEPARFESYFELLKKWFSVAAYRPEIGHFAMAFDDITERKKAEEMLRESEQRFRCLVEDAAAGVGIIDLKGRFMYVNKTLADSLGYSVQELAGRPFKDFLHPDDRGKVVRLFLKSILLRRPLHNFEFRVIHKDGHVLHCMSKPTKLVIDGRTVGFQAILTDITARKKTEETLLKSEKKYRELVEVLNEGIWVIDKDAYTTFANPRIAELLEYTVDEMQGKHLFSFMDEKGVEIAKHLLERRKQGIEEQHDFEFVRKDGKRIYAILETTTLTDENGNYMGAIAAVMDVTERRKTEKALRESEEKLRNVFVASPDAITVSDLNGNIVECNQATVDLHGYQSREGIIGKNALEFIAKKDHEKATENLKKILEHGSAKNVEYTFLTKDGREFSGELSSSVLRDASGKPEYFMAITKDITRRKKAEEELAVSEKKFKSIFEGARDGILAADEKTKKFVLANPRICEITGYSEKELLRLGVEDIHPEKDLSYVMDVFRKQVQKKIEVGRDIPVLRKDRDVIYCDINSFHLEIGERKLLVGLFRDSTERKVTEDALRNSESRYRTLLENIPQKIFLKDRNSVYVSCNENYAGDLKIKPNEIEGKTDYDFHSKRLAEKYRADDKRTVETGETEDITEEYIQNGQKVYVHTVKTPVKDENGNVVGVLGIFWDITERRLMEQKYSTIVKTVLDGFLINDSKGRLIDVNDAYCRLIGYTREELLSMSISDIEASEKPEETAGHITKVMKEGYDRFETRQMRKDGTVIDVEVSTTYYPVGEGQLVVFLRDTTERKKMEAQLKEYTEHLEEKVEERTNQLKKTQEQLLKTEKMAVIGAVAAMVGHDLRNPLQAITNTLYLSEKKFKSIPIMEKEILEKHGFLELWSGFKDQAEYMEKIVSDLQDYARPMKPTPVEIGLHQLINRALSSLTVPESVKVSIVVEKDFPKLMLDPTLMQRVFSNLITNAVQAMPNGGKLTIRAYKKEETTLMSIEDTGEGISDENLSKLFTPLFTTKAKGQGFGLPVCKRMVEAHDGNITVESKVGKGSTFTIKIPLRKEVSYN